MVQDAQEMQGGRMIRGMSQHLPIIALGFAKPTQAVSGSPLVDEFRLNRIRGLRLRVKGPTH
jgi:hypothetical protein